MYLKCTPGSLPFQISKYATELYVRRRCIQLMMLRMISPKEDFQMMLNRTYHQIQETE